MSNIIEVTPERLHNDAALLRQKANKIQAELDNVEQQIRSLSAADFEGLAASDFLAEYHRLRNMLQMLPKILAMFSQQLDQAGNEFADVDRRLTSL
jgi:WXG100 family type VII secretion target